MYSIGTAPRRWLSVCPLRHVQSVLGGQELVYGSGTAPIGVLRRCPTTGVRHRCPTD